MKTRAIAVRRANATWWWSRTAAKVAALLLLATGLMALALMLASTVPA